MTPKQILDSFSATLMQDERILSAQERALLSSLLQHAKAAAGESQDTQAAVRRVVAAAVGETVAQRAFSILGGSIVEQILEGSSLAASETASTLTPVIVAKQPQPPAKQPQPPATDNPSRQPQPPALSQNYSRPEGRQPQPPAKQPQPPATGNPPGQPQPPARVVQTGAASETGVCVADRPAVLLAKCVVLDEFLAPQELEELVRFTLDHEADFRASELVSPVSEAGVIDYEHRRSRVLMDLAQQQDRMLDRIKTALPQVLGKLEMEEFRITGTEAQITASSDGDFFRFHSDNGSGKVADRHLTFVYFFHREPRQFEGGELRIHDARLEGETYVSTGSYQTIVPQQNQIVFFPCELMHEVTPVRCTAQLFADSRFTLNGWLHR